MDFGEDCLGYVIGAVIAIALLYWTVTLLATGIYWLAATVSYWLMTVLAWLSSESLMPKRPEIMWALWGGLAGAVLGFWPSAPLYGLRKHRGALLWMVVVLMFATASCVSFRLKG